MALIVCPDCGKEISDKTKQCIHCGCPIEPSNEFPDDKIREINGITVNIDALIREHGRDNIAMAMHLKEIAGASFSEAKKIAKVEFNNRGIKPLGFFERSQMKVVHNPDTEDHFDEALDIQRKQLKIQKKMFELEKKQNKAMAKCPKCGSTSLSGNKKGFGIGKAVLGVAITANPLGLIAGNIGAKKVRVTCLKCGKQFWA